MSWRDRLRPASFRGVEFKVDVGGPSGGRRIALHEFPKKDTPYSEDMGRRARRFRLTGYVIGEDYDLDAQDLGDALDEEGPGLLVHPTRGEMMVVCDDWNSSESRERGRMAEFNLSFIEAGEEPGAITSGASQSQAKQAAETAEESASTGVDAALGGGSSSNRPLLT